MTIIEIEEKKVEKLSEHIEEGLRHLGKAMQCVEMMMEESGMGERSGSYGNRGGQGGGRYGNRYGEREGGQGGYSNRYGERGGYGMREEDEWEDEMMERRGVRGSGRGRR